MFKKLPFLMAEAEDDEKPGGGAKVDRGDEFEATDEDADVAVVEKDEEVEGKAEVDGKAEDEEEKTEEKPRGKDGKFLPHMVPTARLAEVTKKAQETIAAREARIAELEKSQRSVETTKDTEALEKDITLLETALEEARIDNNRERTLALAREIRLKERQVQQIEARALAAATREASREDGRYESALEAILTKFPMLNDKHETYDKELEEEVVDMMTGFQRNGMKPAAALAKAMSYIELKIEKMGGGDEDESEEDAGKKGERSQKQLKKNLDAAKKLPASLGTKGADSDKKGGGMAKNFEKMTDEERDAIPESTRARLRGDYVE